MSMLEELREAVVVAVLRSPTADAALTTVDALVAGGVRAVEITYSTPSAASVVATVRERHDVLVGAGTVTTAAQAREAADAGAGFLVSPGTTPPVAEAMAATGVPFALGALTPSEVMAAVALGADVVKVFPGSLGGPSYLRALRGPFPDVPFMPTGGVSRDNLREWLDAGAVCVGAGGELVADDPAETTRRAAAFVEAAGAPT